MGTNISVDTYCDIAIIGGGASGMMAAVIAAQKGKKVCIFEAGDRIGKKILATGNGKCNLSHVNISADNYYGSGADKVLSLLDIFSTDDTVRFFESIGLIIRDKDGYLYPYSETAQSVLDALRFKISTCNIEIVSECKVSGIVREKDKYLILSENGKKYPATKVILATGGKAAPKTGSDGSGLKIAEKLGLEVVKPRPALCKVISDDTFCKAVDGVRAKGKVSLLIDDKLIREEYGEIQFTKDGLSGIPVFNMSRLVSYAVSDKQKVKILLDLVPDLSLDELVHFYKEKNKDTLTAEMFFSGVLNKKITLAVMALCKIKGSVCASNINDKEIRKFCTIIKAFEYNITGVYGFDSAQVTAGGIHFDEVTDCLESKRFPGLFMAGEVLDIDGICGGYNLQWAWTSGYIAGSHAAES